MPAAVADRRLACQCLVKGVVLAVIQGPDQAGCGGE